jgi:nuclear pore complex protein Nup93
LFGGFDQSQQQRQAQQQGQNAQLGKSASSSTLQAAYFDQILERGRKRNTQENGGLGDLPTLQLGLGDIARKVRNLGTGGTTAQHSKANDSRA